MRRFIILLLTLYVASIALPAQSLYVGEFNIRYDNPKDAEQGNGWAVRRGVVCDILKVESFDVFGAQEVLSNQLEDICKALPAYNYIGVGRNDGRAEGEFAPVFYRTDRIKCLSSGTFWLSQTPETVGSKGWDAKYPRICTWGQFKDLMTGRKFWMFNLHMDHRGVEARRESAKLVMDRIRKMCGKQPFILLGDFNVDQYNPIYPMMMESGLFNDAFDAAAVRLAPTGSMNHFNPEFHTDSRIDHVFVSKQFQVIDYKVMTNVYWSDGIRFPSDHYPIGIHLNY